MTQPFVFDDGSVVDSLIFAEHTVGKRDAITVKLTMPIKLMIPSHYAFFVEPN